METLEKRGLDAAVDPVFLLGYRMAFLTDEQAADVRNGKTLRTRDIVLFEAPRRFDDSDCGPLRGAHRCADPLAEGEVVSLVHENELVALIHRPGEAGRSNPAVYFPKE